MEIVVLKARVQKQLGEQIYKKKHPDKEKVPSNKDLRKISLNIKGVETVFIPSLRP
jgi:hypothetical protein